MASTFGTTTSGSCGFGGSSHCHTILIFLGILIFLVVTMCVASYIMAGVTGVSSACEWENSIEEEEDDDDDDDEEDVAVEEDVEDRDDGGDSMFECAEFSA